jgi:hypothetical protein
MSHRTFIEVGEDTLQDMVSKMSRIVRPTAEYNNNHETYLKGVIAEQTDRAVVVMAMLNKLLDVGDKTQ